MSIVARVTSNQNVGPRSFPSAMSALILEASRMVCKGTCGCEKWVVETLVLAPRFRHVRDGKASVNVVCNVGVGRKKKVVQCVGKWTWAHAEHLL